VARVGGGGWGTSGELCPGKGRLQGTGPRGTGTGWLRQRVLGKGKGCWNPDSPDAPALLGAGRTGTTAASPGWVAAITAVAAPGTPTSSCSPLGALGSHRPPGHPLLSPGSPSELCPP